MRVISDIDGCCDVLVIRFMCVVMSFLCYFVIHLCCSTYVICDDVCFMFCEVVEVLGVWSFI